MSADLRAAAEDDPLTATAVDGELSLEVIVLCLLKIHIFPN